MSRNRIFKFVASALGGAVFTLGAGNASAYSVNSSMTSSDSLGNGNFYAKYFYRSQEGSNGGGGQLLSRSSMAAQRFYVHAKLFGKQITAIDWEAVGSGSMRRLSGSPEVYEDEVGLKAVVIGDELFNHSLGDRPCGDDATQSCVSFEKTVSKTLFKREASFMVSFVPVTVYGDLVGSFGANGASGARATHFLGRADSLRGSANARLEIGAFVESKLRAVAGIENILAVGVTAKIRYIDASLSSISKSAQDAPFGSGARVVHTNHMPLTIKSLSGKVDLWADITPFIREKINLINHPGYSWTKTLIGFENEVVDAI